jgi:hypothetical protein
LAVYARWTNAHGSYAIEVQLRNLDGDLLSGCKMEVPFEATDPLQIWTIPLHRLPIQIPTPGKYDVLMLANGKAVAIDTLIAHLTRPETSES